MRQNDNSYPRTLIISANSLSTQTNNGKMIASFFKEYPVERLAQLFIWPEYPDSDICNNYFRITDADMVKSWTGKTPGQEVCRRHVQCDCTTPQIFKSQVKNWSILRLARDIIWSNEKWNNQRLWNWIDKFTPEVVFFVGINHLALYRIAEKITRRFNTPTIVYITDDYFLPRFSLSPFFHIRRILLERNMKKILNGERTKLLTVNKYMREKYLDYFGVESMEIFHCAPVDDTIPLRIEHGGPIVVSYIGNLMNNRLSTLKTFKQILSKYPRKESFSFQIYTREIFSERQLKKFTQAPYLTYCGGLDAQEVKVQLLNSDVLMHLESFRYNNRKDTLLSLSTKLTEYMATARTIFMIGPSEVGSMRFLTENTHSVTVNKLSKKNVFEALDLLLDSDYLQNTGKENFAVIKELLRVSNTSTLVSTVSQELLEE